MHTADELNQLIFTFVCLISRYLHTRIWLNVVNPVPSNMQPCGCIVHTFVTTCKNRKTFNFGFKDMRMVKTEFLVDLHLKMILKID